MGVGGFAECGKGAWLFVGFGGIELVEIGWFFVDHHILFVLRLALVDGFVAMLEAAFLLPQDLFKEVQVFTLLFFLAAGTTDVELTQRLPKGFFPSQVTETLRLSLHEMPCDELAVCLSA